MKKWIKYAIIGGVLGAIWGMSNLFFGFNCPDYTHGCRVFGSIVYVPTIENIFSINTIMFLYALPTFGDVYILTIYLLLIDSIFDPKSLTKESIMGMILSIAFFVLPFFSRIIIGVLLGFLISLLFLLFDFMLEVLRKRKE